MAPRYNVVLSYATHADSPEEAIRMARDAISEGNGAYVEVFEAGDDEAELTVEQANEAVVEGDLEEFSK